LNDDKRRDGSGDPVVYHYTDTGAEPNYVFLQSWMFYPSSETDLTRVPGQTMFHEGDWEMFQFTIRRRDLLNPHLKSTWLQPFAATASQHYYGQTLKWKADSDDIGPAFQDQDYIEKSGDRPVIYVAKGTHATYFRSGDFYTTPGENPQTQHQYESIPPDRLTHYTYDTTLPPSTAYQFELREIEQDDRLVRYWRGRWGKAGFEDGPVSPEYRSTGSLPTSIFLLRQPSLFHNTFLKTEQATAYQI
jgi:hypothetical protein